MVSDLSRKGGLDDRAIGDMRHNWRARIEFLLRYPFRFAFAWPGHLGVC